MESLVTLYTEQSDVFRQHGLVTMTTLNMMAVLEELFSTSIAHLITANHTTLNITTTIETFYQDEQCASNRVGILRGTCQPGLSLVLGSSKCFHCSYFHLLLFFVFAIAGLVLILLLVSCNLTVSEGTVNGLIFYANIVQINCAAFFPATRSYFDRNTYNIHSLVESRSWN